MHADLVRAPGARPRLDQSVCAEGFERRIGRLRRLAAAVNAHLPGTSFIRADRLVHRARFLQPAQHDRVIHLLDCAGREQPAVEALGLQRQSEEQHAAGAEIEPVQAARPFRQRPGADALLRPGRHRARKMHRMLAPAARLDRQARRLLDCQQMLVFVQHFDRHRRHSLARVLLQRLIEHHDLPCAQRIPGLRRAPVHGDAPGAHEVADAALRHARPVRGEKFVERAAGPVVFHHQ
jgi:hypothetical protein